MSWCDHDFLGRSLSQIPWSNFKIIDTPAWSGRAKRFFKHKQINVYCTKCKRKHGRRALPSSHPCKKAGYITTLHEYLVYQNENVKNPLTKKKGEPRNEKHVHHHRRHSGHDCRCPPRSQKSPTRKTRHLARSTKSTPSFWRNSDLT